jgi:hypothetical protein
MNKRPISRRLTILLTVTVFIIIVLIKIATFFPKWIELNYSTGIYPSIARIFRAVFGWFPLSVGDLLYLAAGVYIAVKIYRLIKIIRRRRWDSLKVTERYVRIFFVLAGIYIFFNIFWGLNYNRLGIAYQLDIHPKEHTAADLKQLTSLLVYKLNNHRVPLGEHIAYSPYNQVFSKAQVAYANANQSFSFIQYKTGSVKRSLYGRLGIYLGFLGYYNPFTGESQLNLTQPRFLLPFVTCHEIAHQLGYASESEANFVGYLAALKAGDPLFEYSAYFDMFNYANRELYLLDTASARGNVRQLDTLVRKDIRELREYYKKSDNVVEPIIKLFYDQYLKANQQEEGVQSYNEVVGWMVAYYKKFGTL